MIGARVSAMPFYVGVLQIKLLFSEWSFTEFTYLYLAWLTGTVSQIKLLLWILLVLQALLGNQQMTIEIFNDNNNNNFYLHFITAWHIKICQGDCLCRGTTVLPHLNYVCGLLRSKWYTKHLIRKQKGAGMSLGWERSPPTKVAWGVICPLSLLLLFALLQGFSPKKTSSPKSNSTGMEDLHKNQPPLMWLLSEYCN